MFGNKVFLRGVDEEFPLEAVNVRGVFANVSNLVTDCSNGVPLKCFDKDTSRYPIPETMIAPLIDMIYSKELNIERQAITTEPMTINLMKPFNKTDDDVTTETP